MIICPLQGHHASTLLLVSKLCSLISPSLSLSLSLRIIHENGFTRDECKQYRPVVYSNTIQSLAAVIRGMDLLGLNFADPARRVSQALSLLISFNAVTVNLLVHIITQLQTNVGVSSYVDSGIRIIAHSMVDPC